MQAMSFTSVPNSSAATSITQAFLAASDECKSQLIKLGNLLFDAPLKKQFKAVEYQGFRHVIDSCAGNKIQQEQGNTYIYDKANRLIAILSSGSIDQNQPCQYYVRSF